jgi:hypothetical protein
MNTMYLLFMAVFPSMTRLTNSERVSTFSWEQLAVSSIIWSVETSTSLT